MKKSLILFCLMFYVSAACAKDFISTFTLPSGVKVEINEATFQRSLFRIKGCSEQDLVCRINDHIPAGLTFGLPKTYVSKIVVSYNGNSYLLDSSDMYNAWSPRPLEYRDKIRYFGGKCLDKNNCQFRGIFSDAAGTFVAEWKIVNGLPTRTVLTNSNDVVSLFEKHIDPPEFE